jgi:hypothetical protein
MGQILPEQPDRRAGVADPPGAERAGLQRTRALNAFLSGLAEIIAAIEEEPGQTGRTAASREEAPGQSQGGTAS